MHQKTIYYFLLLILAMPFCTLAATDCPEALAKVISIQGKVDVQNQNKSNWKPLEKDYTFCFGDKIRTLKNSRATLFFNNTRVTLDQNTTLTFKTDNKKESSWVIDLINGFAFFRSHYMHNLTVTSPWMNVAHKGTEFLVTVNSKQTTVTVFDGQVAASNPQGEILVEKGYVGIAGENQAPRIQALTIRPEDAVQWSLYYPAIIDYGKVHTPADASLQSTINANLQNNPYKALTLMDAIPASQQNVGYLTQKSSLLLLFGQVEQAITLIDKALVLKPENSTAIALKSIIAVTKNRQDKALSLAQTAVQHDPHSAIAQIALSYAYQSKFDIESALKATKEAVRLSPDNALAWARLSELQLSTGERDDALESAQKAQSLNPKLGRTQTILGFASLALVNIDRAKSAFTKAINLNSSDPLAHLGLGLAKIRKGDIEEGTSDIETAVSQDPDNAIMRSYLGKAYYELRNDEFAETELSIAKEKDPNDPTPWFYDAIRKQTTNRPVEALHDMQKAIELNDNRGVYRSKLLLDEDLAARNASLGRIYNDLGFQQQGLVESWKSIYTNPANYSAHRLLADNYAALPRHEIARVSELLQAQLLQPVHLSPLQPQLIQNNLNTTGIQGPSTLSANEYNPLFTKDGFSFVGNTTFGSNDLWSEDAILSGVYKNISASLSQFHFETDGFQENADLKQDIYNGFVQVALTNKLSLQTQVSRVEIDSGDVFTRANNSRRLGYRKEIKRETLRIGLHYQLSPNQDIIASGIYQDNELDTLEFISFGPGGPFIRTEQSSSALGFYGEMQHIFRHKFVKTIAGLGYIDLQSNNIDSDFFVPSINSLTKFPLGNPDIINDHIEHFNSYLYSSFFLPYRFTAIAGVSYDSFRRKPVDNPFGRITDSSQVNPKFGLIWEPNSNTTIRGAAFRVLKRTVVANLTIEPTQIAGFNQFFDDITGEESWRYGIGLDQIFSSNFSAGFELSWRDLTRPLFSGGRQIKRKRDETFHRTYLNWTPHSSIAISSQFQFEDSEREFTPGFGDLTNPQRIKTYSVPFTVNYFHPNGLFSKLGITYIDQKTKFVTANIGGNLLDTRKDNFWVIDASIGYRLPRRYGQINIGVSNLLDQNFLYQSQTASVNTQTPQLPTYKPERTFHVEFNVSFL